MDDDKGSTISGAASGVGSASGGAATPSVTGAASSVGGAAAKEQSPTKSAGPSEEEVRARALRDAHEFGTHAIDPGQLIKAVVFMMLMRGLKVDDLREAIIAVGDA